LGNSFLVRLKIPKKDSVQHLENSRWMWQGRHRFYVMLQQQFNDGRRRMDSVIVHEEDRRFVHHAISLPGFLHLRDLDIAQVIAKDLRVDIWAAGGVNPEIDVLVNPAAKYSRGGPIGRYTQRAKHLTTCVDTDQSRLMLDPTRDSKVHGVSASATGTIPTSFLRSSQSEHPVSSMLETSFALTPGMCPRTKSR
jgi:hypothetical protein